MSRILSWAKSEPSAYIKLFITKSSLCFNLSTRIQPEFNTDETMNPEYGQWTNFISVFNPNYDKIYGKTIITYLTKWPFNGLVSKQLRRFAGIFLSKRVFFAKFDHQMTLNSGLNPHQSQSYFKAHLWERQKFFEKFICRSTPHRNKNGATINSTLVEGNQM